RHERTSHPIMSFIQRYFLFYIVLAVVGLSFYVGFSIGKQELSIPLIGGREELTNKVGKVLNAEKTPPKYLGKDVDFNLFWDVWKRVKTEHVVKDTPDTKLFYGALAGIVSSLNDPYSVFLEPDTAKRFDESLSGSFEGIGAEIGMKKEQIVIVSPLPDTPADKAGLRAGDRILAIDKTSTVGMTLDVAVTKIRGKGGTKVTLTIYRDGEKKERDIGIVRGKIQVKSVELSMKDEQIAYVKISHFSEDTLDGFRKAVRELLSKKAKSIILDLRNNPGGFMDTSIQVSGYWVNGETVVIQEDNEGKRKEFKGKVTALLKDMPTVVLINQGSASASEIVSGALQDHGKAKVVGKKSFGKGSVQNLERLKDGSALKLTVARWLTPKGRSINEHGIDPDVEVEVSDEDFENKRDPQLDKALELLKEQK
ncbi:MAG: S41 family peptidase, partial [bacterium]|nr:S41 family peptidase [bacterium]